MLPNPSSGRPTWRCPRERAVSTERQHQVKPDINQVDVGDRNDNLPYNNHALVQNAVERLAERDVFHLAQAFGVTPAPGYGPSQSSSS